MISKSLLLATALLSAGNVEQTFVKEDFEDVVLDVNMNNLEDVDIYELPKNYRLENSNHFIYTIKGDVNGLGGIPTEDGEYTCHYFIHFINEDYKLDCYHLSKDIVVGNKKILAQAEAEVEAETETEAPLTWDNLFNDIQSIISVVVGTLSVGNIIMILTLLAKYLSKKSKFNKSEQELIVEVIGSVDKYLKENLENYGKDQLIPVVKKLQELENTNKVFAKVLALLQDKSPEAKLALLNLLSELKTSDVVVIEKAKETITKEEEKSQKKKEQVAKELNELDIEEENLL